MNKFKRAKMKFLLVSSLIAASTLLMHVDFARAGGQGGIDPNQAMETVTLLSGQNFTFSTTQTTQFGSHSVRVVSMLNRQLTATIIPQSTEASGIWWIILIGTGKMNLIDIGFGLISLSISFFSLLNPAKSSKKYLLPAMDRISASLGCSGFLKL